LANDRAIGPVLKLLKSTEVGSRARARERELEWQARNNGERESLLFDERRQEKEKTREEKPKGRKQVCGEKTQKW